MPPPARFCYAYDAFFHDERLLFAATRATRFISPTLITPLPPDKAAGLRFSMPPLRLIR